MTAAVPEQLRGLWRREVLVAPDGSRDTTTEVFWLQGEGLFADLRIPAGRPNAPGRRSFADYGDADLLSFARMAGFGGTLEVDGDICRWHHALDYHPPGGAPDEARYTLKGDTLVETGIHAPYEEIWHRETPLGAPAAAFRLVEDSEHPGRGGILVVVGGVFLLIQDRATPLPEAPSLAALVEADLADGARERATGRLDMLIAHGQLEGGWPIGRSTCPWREATSLFAGRAVSFDPGSGELELGSLAGRQVWRLAECTMSAAALASCFG